MSQQDHIKQVTETLRRYNDWRMGADIPQPDPAAITAAINSAIALLNSMRPAP